MGRDCRLVLKATLKAPAGKALAKFCRDWHFIEELTERPTEPYLLQTFKKCENLFIDFFDEDRIDALEKGHLDLSYEGKIDEEALEVLVEDFLPAALIECKVFFVEMEEMNSRREFTFDPKTRKLSEEERSLEAPASLLDSGTEVWEEEYGSLSAEEWRDHLSSLLVLIADESLQKGLFIEEDESYDFDPPYTDFEIWFDINAYYMGRLNLEVGLSWAKEQGFLTAAECARLAPLDTAFRTFLPEDLATRNAGPILRDPEWKAICKAAAALLKERFLKSK